MSRSCSPTLWGSFVTCSLSWLKYSVPRWSEIVDADLLLHVVDGSGANLLTQINAVRQVISAVIYQSPGWWCGGIA
nr:hypothetical protein [Mycobacterium uberis]